MIKVKRRHRVLVFQDNVGITAAYMPIWKKICAKAGLVDTAVQFQLRSAYSVFPKNKLIEWHKTRKQPGFNTEPKNQRALAVWIKGVLDGFNPDLVICMDPSMLWGLNRDWNQATLDRLRGGVYILEGVPWLVSLPITAVNTKMKQADIAKLNEGFTEKADYDEFRESEDGDEPEDDEEKMEWHEPIVTPYGKFCLDQDMAKASRILSRIKVEDIDT